MDEDDLQNVHAKLVSGMKEAHHGLFSKGVKMVLGVAGAVAVVLSSESDKIGAQTSTRSVLWCLSKRSTGLILISFFRNAHNMYIATFFSFMALNPRLPKTVLATRSWPVALDGFSFTRRRKRSEYESILAGICRQ